MLVFSHLSPKIRVNPHLPEMPRLAGLNTILLDTPPLPWHSLFIDGISISDAPRTLVESGRINAIPTIIGFLSEDMWPHNLYKAIIEWCELMGKGEHPPVWDPVTCENSRMMHFGETPCEMISVPEEKLEYNQKYLPTFPPA